MTTSPFIVEINRRYMLLFMVTILSSCTRLQIEKSTPTCVKDKIVEFKKSKICDDLSVEEYTFQGLTVYVFNSGTCGADLQSEVIDSDCNYLGALGGIAGNIEINGEIFSNAIFIKTVWKK